MYYRYPKMWSLFAAISVLSVAGKVGYAQDRSSPAATVRSFSEVFGTGELAKASACVLGAKSSPASAKLEDQVKQHPRFITLGNLKTSSGDMTAKVSVETTMSGGDIPENELPRNGRSVVNLKRMGKLWLIVPTNQSVTPPVLGHAPDVLNQLANLWRARARPIHRVRPVIL